MKNKKNLPPKTLDLNIFIEESAFQQPHSEGTSLNFKSSENKLFSFMGFDKSIKSNGKKDKENICFSNFSMKKKNIFPQEFNSKVPKEDDFYIKKLRGIVKKNLFNQEKDGFLTNQGINMKKKNNKKSPKNDKLDKFKEDFLFNVYSAGKILSFLDFLDLLNFQYICKKTFRPEFKSMIKSLVCKRILKV